MPKNAQKRKHPLNNHMKQTTISTAMENLQTWHFCCVHLFSFLHTGAENIADKRSKYSWNFIFYFQIVWQIWMFLFHAWELLNVYSRCKDKSSLLQIQLYTDAAFTSVYNKIFKLYHEHFGQDLKSLNSYFFKWLKRMSRKLNYVCFVFLYEIAFSEGQDLH